MTGKVVIEDRSGTDSGAEGRGSIGVTPSSVEMVGICESTSAEVVVRNTGDAVLSIEGSEIVGSGWTLEEPPMWPAALDSGDALTLMVSGTAGEATLLIRSDDPVQGTVEVALAAFENVGPALTVEAPSASEIIDEGAELTLTAVVSDPDASVEGLVVSWSSNIHGDIGTATTDSTGRAELVWSGADREVGSHLITASVADACGAEDTMELGVCQQGDVQTEASGYGSWQFAGDASWDVTNDWLEVTPTGTYRAGGAFDSGAAMVADDLSVNFDFKVGGGTGGDGFALVALDRDRMTGTVARAGGCLGFSGDTDCPGEGTSLPGWAVEFDNVNNVWDPTRGHHLEVVIDGDVRSENVWGVLPDLRDTGWHTASVTVEGSQFVVAIDGVTYLDREVSGDFSFPAMLGFTGGSAFVSNAHLIDNVSYRASACAPE